MLLFTTIITTAMMTIKLLFFYMKMQKEVKMDENSNFG